MSSDKDLEKRLQVYMQEVIEREILRASYNEIKDVAVDIVKKHIDDDVYAVYNPEVYKREYSLRDSVSASIRRKNKDVISLSIGHDADKLTHYNYQNPDYKDVPYLVQEGKIHPFGDPDLAYLKPRPYMENSEEEIREAVYTIIESKIK